MSDSGTAREAVTNLRELDAWIEREGIRFFKIGVFDIDGVLRGKYVDREKLRSAVDTGFGFCDVVLGWDLHDTLYERVEVSGWHTGYRDAPVRLDLASLRRIPFEEDTLLLIGSFAGDYAAVCPRTILARTLERAAGLGFGVDAAFEYEFFLFDETPRQRAREGLPRSPARDARHVRLLRAAKLRPRGVLPRPARDDGGLRLCDRGTPHRDGTGRRRGGDPLCARPRGRRPGRALQDLHEGLRPARRADGDLHGEVEQRLPRPERPPAHLAGRPRERAQRLPRRGRRALDERDDATLRRRAGPLPARAAGDGRARRSTATDAWSRDVGADGLELGRREPHHRDPRDPRRPEGPAQRVPDRPRRRESLPRPGRGARLGSARDRGAPRAARRRSPATPTRTRRRRRSRCRRRCATRAGRCASRRWRARASATPSSITSARPATGRIASSARP